MRALLAVLFIAVLIVVGWRQSFREHYSRLAGVPLPSPTPSVHTAAARSLYYFPPKPTPWRPKSTTLDPPRTRSRYSE